MTSVADNRDRGLDVEDESCSQWPLEPVADDRDPRDDWYDSSRPIASTPLLSPSTPAIRSSVSPAGSTTTHVAVSGGSLEHCTSSRPKTALERFGRTNFDTHSQHSRPSPSCQSCRRRPAVAAVLLSAETPLTQTELAERADVSTRSVRNNTPRLEALGLLDRTEGYRLMVSFRTAEERRPAVVPRFVDNRSLLDATSSLLETMLPAERYGDPEDPIGAALFWPPDPWLLLDDDDLEPWAALASRLTATEQPNVNSAVSMDADPEQTALQEVTA